MVIQCSECHCVERDCKDVKFNDCNYCTKDTCCCTGLHTDKTGISKQPFVLFFGHVRIFFAAALGIEILCITAAVIGEIKNFGIGISKLFSLRRQSNVKYILKTSLIILFTAETVCILTAETVDLVFYNYSLLLSIPLALLAGTMTVVLQEAYKEVKMQSSARYKPTE